MSGFETPKPTYEASSHRTATSAPEHRTPKSGSEGLVGTALARRRSVSLPKICTGILTAAVLLSPLSAFADGPWRFTDVTRAAGFNYSQGFAGPTDPQRLLAAGVASGDYDGDGWADLYVIRGSIGPNLLFHNRGDGTFEERAAVAGLAVTGEPGTGATFGDIDGDGDLDIITGGLAQLTAPMVFRNRGDGTFENYTTESGIDVGRFTFSSTFGDIDDDGDLDVMLTFWNRGPGSQGRAQMWRNDGAGHFSDASRAAFGNNSPMLRTNAFTPNWADINSDGHPDILVSADFGTSWYALNNGDGTFTDATTSVISDENGMGSTIGDYDNDGDLDWFISSIWEPEGEADGTWGVSGNRLYRNDGFGDFEDVTDEAGVREGFWGWGSCFADFNNDGHLDLFHVNGYPIFETTGVGEDFLFDPSRMFVNNGDGTFTQRAEELGVADTDQGRGIVCFDYDRDGDIDLFVANYEQEPTLYRNDGGNDLNFLALRLRTPGPNTFAVHARVSVTAGGMTQIREVGGHNNYLSHNPPGDAHFGLGTATQVDEVTITWPDGEVTTLEHLPANQFVTLTQGGSLDLDVLSSPGHGSPVTFSLGVRKGNVHQAAPTGIPKKGSSQVRLRGSNSKESLD